MTNPCPCSERTETYAAHRSRVLIEEATILASTGKQRAVIGHHPSHGHPRHLHNPPPDPNPRKPAHPVPDMAWDCHIHLFGPAREFPFEATSPYTSDDALPEDYLRMQRPWGSSAR